MGNAGLWVAEQAVQLHGAMGVTNEAVVGQYLKRMVVVDRLFGDSRHQITALVDAAVQGRAESEARATEAI